MTRVAEIAFHFPHNPVWDQLVHVYLGESWAGEPTESEEMKPAWFSLPTIPFSHMWPDDTFWLPEVLKGKFLKASFKFGEGDVIQEKEIDIVDEI
jgi:8-oxo-dGTP diphosphatase